MSTRLLLYGAAGLSGRSLANALRNLGPRLILAARDESAVATMGAELGLEHRTFDLLSPAAIDRGIRGVRVLLNAAGPFTQTAPALLAACLRRGVDYLDITGEWPVVEHAMHLSAEAERTGVMLLPAAALAGAVTDCALALVAGRADWPVRLRLGLSRPHAMSRGSLATMIGLASPEVLVRRDGVLTRIPAGRLTHDFDFGSGPDRAVAVSMPDVLTAPHSTGIETIETYSQIDTAARLLTPIGTAAAPLLRQRVVGAAVRGIASRWPPPITPHGFTVVAEAEDRWRRKTIIRIATLDGYSTTTAVAAAIARRVLAGARRTGFATASSLFGADFILTLPRAIAEIPPAAAATERCHAVC